MAVFSCFEGFGGLKRAIFGLPADPGQKNVMRQPNGMNIAFGPTPFILCDFLCILCSLRSLWQKFIGFGLKMA